MAKPNEWNDDTEKAIVAMLEDFKKSHTYGERPAALPAAAGSG